ncbi:MULTISPECIES: hypothetical protein [Pseudobutyrivibrio]|uniref:Uncharacterized protein n=1 Tax=Pseudobutyrivibrio xylanivorans TaxID=185007 RepID=A0A1G5S2W8_PSEXY|nr:MULTISPECIES: hypothetical protein [Pseudobutyrivibrio]MDC7279221.1 hypothetical protein [Butyrivibrio fibrisolvens]SCZ80646.1 hypothetical protein SAMN02910350_02401 [Pseudobutyrivibrio xylanivorans]
MINDFLKKYQEELISEKIQLKEDMDLLETKIKEENKFLNLLEESNESYFKEFTPRNLNAKNNKKAEEIREYLVELNGQLDEKQTQMKFYDGRLVELSTLISNTVVNQQPVVETVEEPISEEIVESEDEVGTNPFGISNSDLIGQLSNIKDLILLDPYRAQIELEKIISTI